MRIQAIFNNIATKMHEKGYEKDWKNKIKNLKKEYRQIKDHNQTGRGRKVSKFYRENQEIRIVSHAKLIFTFAHVRTPVH